MSFLLDVRRNVFSEMVVNHWKRLARDVVGSPSLEVCRKETSWHLGAECSGGLVSDRLRVGLNVKCLSPPQ